MMNNILYCGGSRIFFFCALSSLTIIIIIYLFIFRIQGASRVVGPSNLWTIPVRLTGAATRRRRRQPAAWGNDK